jgi:mannose-6-phosphate isomerase
VTLRKLTPVVLDKVWGTPRTEPWFENPEGRRIGEIWYAAPPERLEELPVLLKFLFTSDRLSVQVHPGDTYARAHGEARGKTEMWHVLRAEPGSTVALGLRENASAERVREAALNGEIVEMLDWVPAREGDTFFIPSGTIHAIGGGLVLCEVQQHSDVTYRLYDYQRKPERPLHLDDSLAVARLMPADCRKTSSPLGEGRELLVECPYFRTELQKIQGKVECGPLPGPALFAAVAGEGTIAGEPFRPGECWLVPSASSFSLDSPDAAFIVAMRGERR